MITQEDINRKLQRLQELADIINLHKRQLITPDQRAELKAWEDKMEFRLNELVAECKIREADIKIAIYEEVVKIINQKKIHV